MPPNFICFFLSFLSTLPAKKTRDFLGSAQKPRELEKGGEAKKSRKRGTGRLIKIEKRERFLSPLCSLFSLFFREEKTGGWVKIQIKSSKTVSSFTHTISLLIVFGNFSKPPNMLSPPVDFFPL